MKIAIIINLLIVVLIVAVLFWFVRNSSGQNTISNLENNVFQVLEK